MYTLYPPIHCYQYDQLAVSDEHSLYYEQSGNPLGLPVLLSTVGRAAAVRLSIGAFLILIITALLPLTSVVADARPLMPR